MKLVALFSPEHGIRGALDQSKIDDTVDEQTGVPVYSLYGKQNKPTEEQLAKIDVLVFDIQDIGTRFYTYPSTMCLAMEAAAKAGKKFVVLDRPNPIDGVTIEGPLLDEGRESFVGLQRLPIRHGMTIGEIATMFAKEREIEDSLTVVKMEGWRRGMYSVRHGAVLVEPVAEHAVAGGRPALPRRGHAGIHERVGRPGDGVAVRGAGCAVDR